MTTKRPVSAGRDNDPCVRNCCLDQAEVCLGCGRKLAEIIEWHGADAARRAAIWSAASKRLNTRRRVRSDGITRHEQL